MSLTLHLDILGLPFQLAISILVTTLLFALTQTVRRRFLDYWMLYWVCFGLGLSMLFVRLQFGFEENGLPGYVFCSLYCFSGYLCVYFLVLGGRQWLTGKSWRRVHLWALAPAAILAGILPWAATLLYGPALSSGMDTFTRLFGVQAVILACGYFVAWIALRGSQKYRRQKVAGSYVLSLGVFAQMLYSVHFLPIIILAGMTRNEAFMEYLHYAVVYDLVLKILLAFGMVIVAMASMREELEVINSNLTLATQRLQHLASKDHLTEALNRHAFYSILEHNRRKRNEPISGCVVVLDIDDLKPINDRYGHSAGDYTIRTVSKAIRSVIRADDLLFRWGGDEFLVILPHVAEAELRSRFDRLQLTLQQVKINSVPVPINIHVSTGIVPFLSLAHLEQAIAEADEAMYAEKVQAKHRFLTPV